MKRTALVLALTFLYGAHSVTVYNVTAHRYSDSPLIANASGAAWKYNYNAAAYTYGDDIDLIVRCQDLKNISVPFAVGPSYLSPSKLSFDSDGNPTATQTEDLAFVPNNTTERCGTEDPRIAYYSKEGLYYMFYTAYNCTNAMLSIATSTNPADSTSWERQGYVFPNKTWSKSGAALFATPENGLSQHYLFWGDSSSPVGGIGIATSKDTVTWEDTGDYLIKVRNNFFDSNLVESGPPPLQLSTGDFLFIYNSARSGYPSAKPDWQLQYNVGYTILSGADPTKVLERSLVPLFGPKEDWEVGNSTEYLTPNVVFLEGLVRDPNGCPSSITEGAPENVSYECFVGVYGGADSDLGGVRIVVQIVDVLDAGESKIEEVVTVIQDALDLAEEIIELFEH